MRLLTLLAAAGLPPVLADPEITGLAYDSRSVKPGDLFFALPGAHTDGSAFATDAASRGASAVVAATSLADLSCPVVVTPNPREAMARLAAAFHGHPARALRCVGITGTNGKTTTAFLAHHILDAVGLRGGLIGTVKYIVAGTELPAPRTTPESADLQEMLAAMVAAGGRSVAMEVSSHALVQHRADAIEFDAAVFTNLTQDHLDFHRTMEAYFEAKARLFELAAAQASKKCRAVVNSDDRYGHRLIERFAKTLRVVTFGQGATADFRASNIKFDANGTTFQLDARGKSYLVRLPLIGLFNVYNALGALAAANGCGVDLRAAIGALARAPQVPGRLERVPGKRNFHVFVDYAHTDDALRNVLRTLRDLQPARLLTVFGCGGDRDRAKRPLMAAVASELSDWTILTSDNPRSEDPEAILADIEAGMTSDRYTKVTDREAAIRDAIDRAGPGDIVLIAGKGHETYQERNSVRTPFDDVEVAARALTTKRATT